MDVSEFYAEEHIRDLFGATEGRPNPHRGVDVAGWLTGTPVPAWVAGTVVTSEWQSGLGWVTVVECPLGFVGVSHLASKGPAVGTYVPFGGSWGPLGNTGSLSEGPHAHLTLSTVSRFPWTGDTDDPLPHIRLARGGASTAGNTQTAIPGETGEDDVSFSDVIAHKSISAPAKVVLVDTLLGVQNAVAAAKDATAAINAVRQVTHKSIDAPTDVVLADTLLVVQELQRKADAQAAAQARQEAAQARLEAAVLAALSALAAPVPDPAPAPEGV